MSPEAAERRKARKRVENLTPEQHERMKQARRQRFQNQTPEQRAALNAKRRERRQALPPGEARRRYNCLPLRSELSPERLQALRDADRRRQSRMTPEEAAAAKAMQDGKCGICAVDLDTLPRKYVCADHCHDSDRPRGLLCHKCNIALGLFGDDEDVLRAAIAYLRRPPLGVL